MKSRRILSKRPSFPTEEQPAPHTGTISLVSELLVLTAGPQDPTGLLPQPPPPPTVREQGGHQLALSLPGVLWLATSPRPHLPPSPGLVQGAFPPGKWGVAAHVASRVGVPSRQDNSQGGSHRLRPGGRSHPLQHQCPVGLWPLLSAHWAHLPALPSTHTCPHTTAQRCLRPEQARWGPITPRRRCHDLLPPAGPNLSTKQAAFGGKQNGLQLTATY